MTIEDEEMFMAVAIQMYAGMLPCNHWISPVLAVLSDIISA
jgi:hypothetical protein